MKRILLMLAFVTVLVGAGLMLLTGSVLEQKGAGEQVSYRTVKATRGSIRKSVHTTGTLAPTRVVEVGTQVSGPIAKLHVDVNDEVTKGQIVAEIDPSLLNAQLAQSESTYRTTLENTRQAERELARITSLFQQDFVARQEVERSEQLLRTARNSLDIAKAQRDRDQVNLGYAIIRSPVNGTVISREVNAGQTVITSLASQTLFKIAEDLEKMQLDVLISESDVAGIQPHTVANFFVQAYPTRNFQGVIRKRLIAPEPTPNGPAYKVIIDVENKEKLLLPGMTATVEIIESEKSEILSIAQAALYVKLPPSVAVTTVPPTSEAEKTPIFILRDNVVQQVYVATGVSDGTNVEVVSGHLQEGDAVIVGTLFENG